jgi:MoaA/NifB/PqqE/SkfB family radical SAM enzyme
MNKNILKGFPKNMINNTKPIFFGIHLKPICNFRCKKCFIGDMNKIQIDKLLDINEIKKIIVSAKNNGFKVLGITGAGEPTLDDRIKEIVFFANKQGLITHIPTNVSLLNKELIKFFKDNNVTLVLSVDTLKENKFIEFSNTNKNIFKNVIKNIDLAQNVFKNTKIIENNQNIHRMAIHMTVSDDNLDEVEDIRKIATEDTLFSISPYRRTCFAN